MAEYFDNETNYCPEAYEQGGFCLVYAGDIFNDRYRVRTKIGFGASATVWLVTDIKTGRHLAMKVLSAQYSTDSDLHELEILQHLATADKDHPGYNHTLQLLDFFDYESQQGLHRCLVFPVMGESLGTYVYKFNGARLPEPVLKNLTEQLLQALSFAHSNGVVHTDIKPDNIMLKMKDESLIDTWYLETTKGCTEPEGLEPDAESELNFLFWPNTDRVHPAEVPCISLANFYLGQEPTLEDVCNVELVLADWGCSTWIDPQRRRTDEVVPVTLRAPELLLHTTWNEMVDIWTLGCVLLDFADNRLPFQGEGPIGNGEWGYDPECHLMEIVELLGEIPASLLRHVDPQIKQYLFDADGKLIARRPHQSPRLEDWLFHLSETGKQQFLDLIYGMFALDPQARLSASQLLHSAWVVEPSTMTIEEGMSEITPPLTPELKDDRVFDDDSAADGSSPETPPSPFDSPQDCASLPPPRFNLDLNRDPFFEFEDESGSGFASDDPFGPRAPCFGIDTEDKHDSSPATHNVKWKNFEEVFADVAPEQFALGVGATNKPTGSASAMRPSAPTVDVQPASSGSLIKTIISMDVGKHDAGGGHKTNALPKQHAQVEVLADKGDCMPSMTDARNNESDITWPMTAQKRDTDFGESEIGAWPTEWDENGEIKPEHLQAGIDKNVNLLTPWQMIKAVGCGFVIYGVFRFLNRR